MSITERIEVGVQPADKRVEPPTIVNTASKPLVANQFSAGEGPTKLKPTFEEPENENARLREELKASEHKVKTCQGQTAAAKNQVSILRAQIQAAMDKRVL